MAQFPQSLIDIIEADTEAKPLPATSSEEIAKVEDEEGFSFPPSYKEFLLHFNGGDIAGYRIYGLYYDWDYARNIIEDVQSLTNYVNGIQEGDIYPFGATWGGDYICFDLREKSDDGEYPVLYWDHEVSEGGDPQILWRRLADSFANFMQEHYNDLIQYYYERVDH